jgi:hypothetical protein
MKRTIYRFFVAIIILILISIIYLSTIGIKTNKLNIKILNQIKKVDKNLDLKLNQVSVILIPFKLKIKAKTIGPELIYKDNVIQLENVKANISLKSLMRDEFSLTGISISTKSIDIKNLISFTRLLKNDPKIYIAKQLIKKGHVIADIEIEFDNLGNIKNNYKVNGFVKDGKINLFSRYNLNKIDFTFEANEHSFSISDLKLNFNNKTFLGKEIIFSKQNEEYLVSGEINNENIKINKEDLKNLIKQETLRLDIQEINFNSENNFNFKINKNFKVNELDINSKIYLNSLKLKNTFDLKKIFPKVKKDIFLENHIIEINYNKDNLSIIGSGKTFLQDAPDEIEYKIFKNKEEIKYNVILAITKNLLEFNFLNYKKKKNLKLEIDIKAKKRIKENLIFEKISIKENNNIIYLKNLILSEDNKIHDIENIKINFLDIENLENKIQLINKDKNYLIKGKSFNLDKIIKNFLDSGDEKKLKLFNNNFKLDFDIKKVYLDKHNVINDFKGHLFFNDNKVTELDLNSIFSNQKDIKLTIKKNGDEQITTLFSNEAKPLVDRYKFIKGFNEGSIDFYSVKNKNGTKSTLKIYDFKLKELPALTKLLTLASLQGIADLVSGEGIRFNEFEMNFSNKNNLMTIDEIYAIGPAISILMSGYIEKDKLVSLRGTLVPATTINKTIGSIPILGNILVGKKTGEGVFGVSFKIKGPPQELETTVNPIKTLTPRFITRTLEKIKKN